MNSFWNKNIDLFNQRFPELSKSLETKKSDDLVLEEGKNGTVTAKYNGLLLHSKYNPVKEAETLISSFDPKNHDTVIFLGFGLGYGPIEFAKKHPDATMILVEKDPSRFFSAIDVLDWSDVFRHKKIILLLGAGEEEVSALLGKCKTEATAVYKTKAQCAHSENYFSAVENALKQNSQKEEINTNTLEKFARLWLNNSCRNLDYLQSLDGVNKYRNLGKEIPFVILAAGPSLESILPHLEEIKKRAMIICVDTALHACLRQNVEPDFIILADPQYYCSLHLDFLSAPSSILITEIAAYPSVLRFKCRETVLFSSLFPIGQFFESQTGEKGKLAAGGSVTTSAWDFARLCKASRIFMAGMDLGYPGKETHIRGSKFEEKAHAESSRTKTSETANSAALFSANPTIEKDYNGNDIITDKRMRLFSWWFETQCTQSRSYGTETFTLTPESLAIKGIEIFSISSFLEFPVIENEKKEFFANAERNRSSLPDKFLFESMKKKFSEDLVELENLAKKGIDITSKALRDRTKIRQSLDILSDIDNHILNSDAKNSASLVFPTKRQLDKMAKEIPCGNEFEKEMYPIQYSKLIYTQILSSVKLFKRFFSSF